LSVKLDDIHNDALRSSDESKVQLAERLIEYLTTHIDPDLDRVHLDTVRSRKEEMKTGQAKPVNGKEGLAQARRILDL
jgi:hypothetical protein